MHHPSFYPVDAHEVGTLRDYDTMLTPNEQSGLTDSFGFTWADYHDPNGVAMAMAGEQRDPSARGDLEYVYSGAPPVVFETQVRGARTLGEWDERRA
jgi:hypothetical protein